METPGISQVEVPMKIDNSRMDYAIELADKISKEMERANEAFETLSQSFKKASSLLNELAECDKSISVETGEPVWTDSISE